MARYVKKRDLAGNWKWCMPGDVIQRHPEPTEKGLCLRLKIIFVSCKASMVLD